MTQALAPMTTREDMIRDRAALRAKYGSLYDELLALMFAHDLIGLDNETNTDEYDPEVRAVLPQLETCQSARDVERVCYDEFVRLFDADIAGPRCRYEHMADAIWDLWRGHPDRPR